MFLAVFCFITAPSKIVLKRKIWFYCQIDPESLPPPPPLLDINYRMKIIFLMRSSVSRRERGIIDWILFKLWWQLFQAKNFFNLLQLCVHREDKKKFSLDCIVKLTGHFPLSLNFHFWAIEEFFLLKEKVWNLRRVVNAASRLRGIAIWTFSNCSKQFRVNHCMEILMKMFSIKS